MSPVALAAAAGLLVLALLATSRREPRVVILALAAASLVAPLLSRSVPSLAVIAVRLVAVLFGSFLVWASLRRRPAGGFAWTVPWPAALAGAAAAALIGSRAASLTGEGAPTGETFAAVTAVALLAASPLVAQGEPIRQGAGAVLLLDATGLLIASGPAGSTPLIEIGLGLAILAAYLSIALANLRGPTQLGTAAGPVTDREAESTAARG